MAVLRVSWCRIPLDIFVYYIIDTLWFDLTSVVLESPAGSSVVRPLGKWHWLKASQAGDGGVGLPPMGSKSAPQWVASNGK